MGFSEINNQYRSMMITTIAIDIKRWRLDEGSSYRVVHQKFQEKYVPVNKWWINNEVSKFGDNSPHGKQMDGMVLCSSAMDCLNESEWW